jgi:Holliday junction resolvase RusA-like endonuclease
MNAISFTIPGIAIAKGRARFSRQGGFVRTHSPEKTVKYENLVKLMASEAMAGVDLFKRPLALYIAIYMPIPTSWSKKRQELALRGLIGATNKPDVSNVLKAIEDGMNGVVYHDDKLIVSGTFSKQYGAVPRVEVRVQEFADKEPA